MNRPIQPWVMILGCATLVIVAILLPALLLRPAKSIEPVITIPVRPPTVARAPATQSPLALPPATKAPAVRPPLAQAPAQAPVTQAPAQSPLAASTPSTVDDGEDLSRAQRFAIMERKTLQALGPEGALTAALPPSFPFPHEREDAIFGIDVSHHNGDKLNWDLFANHKVAFIYAKASEGTKFKDPRFQSHWAALAQKKKIHRGAYHFMSADDDPEEQANYFLAIIGKLQPGDLPPALDLEWDISVRSSRKWAKRDDDYWSNVDPDDIIAKALKWLTVVEQKTGRIPIVYTSRGWWMERIKDEGKVERLKRYPIWISAMEGGDLKLEKPGATGRWAGKWQWTLWQFTNKGDLTQAGSPGGFDVNIFPGKLPEFQLAMGIVASFDVAGKDAGGTAPPIVPPKDPQGPDGARADGSKTGDGAAPPIVPPREPQGADGARADSSKTGDGAAPPIVPPREPQGPDGARADSSKPGDTALLKIPGAGSGDETGSKIPPPGLAQKTQIEITFKNGRILRFDSSVDPEVLARLIAVVDRP